MSSLDQRLSNLDSSLAHLESETSAFAAVSNRALQQLEASVRLVEKARDTLIIKLEQISGVNQHGYSSCYYGLVIPVPLPRRSLFLIYNEKENIWWLGQKSDGRYRGQAVVCLADGRFAFDAYRCKEYRLNVDDIVTIVEHVVKYLNDHVCPAGLSQREIQMDRLIRLEEQLQSYN